MHYRNQLAERRLRRNLSRYSDINWNNNRCPSAAHATIKSSFRLYSCKQDSVITTSIVHLPLPSKCFSMFTATPVQSPTTSHSLTVLIQMTIGNMTIDLQMTVAR